MSKKVKIRVSAVVEYEVEREWYDQPNNDDHILKIEKSNINEGYEWIEHEFKLMKVEIVE